MPNKKPKIAMFYAYNTKSIKHMQGVAEAWKDIANIDFISYGDVLAKFNYGKIKFGKKDLAKYDVFYFRSVGETNPVLALLLSIAWSNGIIVVDGYLSSLGGLERKRKCFEAWELMKFTGPFKIRYPDSYMFTAYNIKEVVQQFLKKHTYPLVIKKVNGRKGKSTWYIKNDVAMTSLSEQKIDIAWTKENKDSYFMVQEYIPNNGDYRLFKVGNNIVGAYKRKPKPIAEIEQATDFNGILMNHSEGGSRKFKDNNIPSDIIKVALAAANHLNINIAGIDIIRDANNNEPVIIEVNSAPQFDVMNRKMKKDVVDDIYTYLVQRAQGEEESDIEINM